MAVLSTNLVVRTPKDGRGISQKQDDMFLIAGRCGTLIRRDKGGRQQVDDKREEILNKEKPR